MTPDPITTAREALAYIAENFSEDVPDEVYSRADTGYDAITAALDLAERRQAENERMNAALEVTQEEGLTEIARLEAELEKLKAERDEANDAAGQMAKALVEASQQITRLTSQLEQAEKVINWYADSKNYTVYLLGSLTLPITMDAGLRASQWIKDCQATGEG